MFLIIGSVIVLGCVVGSYMALGGHLKVLWQPFEFVIIAGAGVGAYIIANPKTVLGRTISGFTSVMRGAKYKKEDYVELLSLLYQVFKLAKTKGMLALESHVDHPHESELFSRFPSFLANHHAQEFLCDYLRLMTLGTDNPHELEALMDQELDTHHQEAHRVSHALQQLAEAFPGLGIVAAVLGVIKTMGAITEPPAVLGALIGAALVGTFLGILLCYGFEEHFDHNHVASVAGRPEVLRGLTDGGAGWARIDRKIGPVRVRTVPSYHDDVQGAQRGRNAIFVLEWQGLRLAHLGDLGHRLDREAVEAIGPVDVVMVPVGGFFTIDAAVATEVVASLGPSIVIPMHYRTPALGERLPIGTVDAFLAGKPGVRRLPNQVSVSADALPASPEIWVLEPPGVGG